MATLYLLPTPLDPAAPGAVASFSYLAAGSVRNYLAEDLSTARRALLGHWKAEGLAPADARAQLGACTLAELSEHTPSEALPTLLEPMARGLDMGLLSEAGLPAVADPGSEAVRWAHQKGHRVVPPVGPSSLLLALAVSGMGGQRFTFNGYLPREAGPRQAALQRLERRAVEGETQLFIETPYRNAQMLAAALAALQPSTWLCVAAGLTGPEEQIRSAPIAEWRSAAPWPLGKLPAVFVIGR